MSKFANTNLISLIIIYIEIKYFVIKTLMDFNMVIITISMTKPFSKIGKYIYLILQYYFYL